MTTRRRADVPDTAAADEPTGPPPPVTVDTDPDVEAALDAVRARVGTADGSDPAPGPDTPAADDEPAGPDRAPPPDVVADLAVGEWRLVYRDVRWRDEYRPLVVELMAAAGPARLATSVERRHSNDDGATELVDLWAYRLPEPPHTPHI